MVFQSGAVRQRGEEAYRLVVRVAERLAHQLAHPVVVLAVFGLQAGHDEGHLGEAGEGLAEYFGVRGVG